MLAVFLCLATPCQNQNMPSSSQRSKPSTVKSGPATGTKDMGPSDCEGEMGREIVTESEIVTEHTSQ